MDARPKELENCENCDLIAADFSCIRWFGNRKDVEKLTTTWNTTIIDRTADLQTSVDVCETGRRSLSELGTIGPGFAAFVREIVELLLQKLSRTAPGRQ